MGRPPDLAINRITRKLARLGERELARLIVNIQRNPERYPPEAESVQTYLRLARKEIRRRRERW